VRWVVVVVTSSANAAAEKKRNASRPDRDFAQNFHRYLRSRWVIGMGKQPAMPSAVPYKKCCMRGFRWNIRLGKISGRILAKRASKPAPAKPSDDVEGMRRSKKK
jgi:hypothetical protein